MMPATLLWRVERGARCRDERVHISRVVLRRQHLLGVPVVGLVDEGLDPGVAIRLVAPELVHDHGGELLVV